MYLCIILMPTSCRGFAYLPSAGRGGHVEYARCNVRSSFIDVSQLMPKKPPPTYESEALGVLAYEFPFHDKAEAEAKIKARLQRKKLGPYDAERIGLLRQMKDELKDEIGKGPQSSYFTQYHDKYVDMRDFDVPRLTRETIARYPQIPETEIHSFVPFCILLYYLK